MLKMKGLLYVLYRRQIKTESTFEELIRKEQEEKTRLYRGNIMTLIHVLRYYTTPAINTFTTNDVILRLSGK